MRYFDVVLDQCGAQTDCRKAVESVFDKRHLIVNLARFHLQHARDEEANRCEGALCNVFDSVGDGWSGEVCEQRGLLLHSARMAYVKVRDIGGATRPVEQQITKVGNEESRGDAVVLTHFARELTVVCVETTSIHPPIDEW